MPSLNSLIFLFSAEFLFYVSGYVVQMITGRLLGPTDFGRFSLVITLTLLIANLIGSGIPITMSKFLSETATKNSRRLPSVRYQSAKAQILVISAITLVFFVSADFIASVLKDPSLAPLFRAATFIIPFYALDSFYFYLFSGMQRIKTQSALKFVRSFLRVSLIPLLTYFFHLRGVFWGYNLVPAGVFLTALAIDHWRPAIPRLDKIENKNQFPLKKIFSLAFPVTFFLVLFEILMSFDLYFLKYFFHNDALAGDYNAALTIARIPSFIFYALTLLLLPSISESSSVANTERTRKIIIFTSRFMLIISAPFIVFTSAYPRTILSLIFGEKFISAASFLPSLAFASSLLAIFYVLAFAYKGAGKIKIPLIAVSVAILFNAILEITILSRTEAKMVTNIKLAVAIGLIFWLWFSLTKVFQSQINLAEIGKIAIASGMIFLLAHWSGDSILTMFLFFPPLLLFYFGLLFSFGVITPEDKKFFLRKKKNNG